MTDVWAKILTDEKHGQVLVTKDWDGDEETDIVVIEVRRRHVMQLRWSFSDEEKRDKAFDQLTKENIATAIAGGVGALERLES